MAIRKSSKDTILRSEQLEDRKLMAANAFGLDLAEPAQAGGMPDIPWLPPEDGMWFTMQNSEASDDIHMITVLWSTPESDADPSAAKWTGFQQQVPARYVDALFSGGDSGVSDPSDWIAKNTVPARAGGMPDIPWLPPEDGMWFRLWDAEVVDRSHLEPGSTSESDIEPSAVKWGGFQGQIPIRQIADTGVSQGDAQATGAVSVNGRSTETTENRFSELFAVAPFVEELAPVEVATDPDTVEATESNGYHTGPTPMSFPNGYHTGPTPMSFPNGYHTGPTPMSFPNGYHTGPTPMSFPNGYHTGPTPMSFPNG